MKHSSCFFIQYVIELSCSVCPNTRLSGTYKCVGEGASENRACGKIIQLVETLQCLCHFLNWILSHLQRHCVSIRCGECVCLALFCILFALWYLTLVQRLWECLEWVLGVCQPTLRIPYDVNHDLMNDFKNRFLEPLQWYVDYFKLSSKYTNYLQYRTSLLIDCIYCSDLIVRLCFSGQCKVLNLM